MTTPPRFFVSPDQIHQGEVTFSREDANHIRNVLRFAKGEKVRVLDGGGKMHESVLQEVGKHGVVARIEKELPISRESTRISITLVQAVAKGEKMDWILQKSTELGVDRIIPVITERTVVKFRPGEEGKRIDRWQRIVKGAAEQSRRFTLPKVDPIQTLAFFLQEEKGSSAAEARLFLFEEEKTFTLKEFFSNRSLESIASLILLIGPEGGFSKEERDAIVSAGFLAVSLGSRILRTETASLAALAMIDYEFS